MKTATLGLGTIDRILTHAEITSVCTDAMAGWHVDNKRVLVLIPDATRTCPLPLMFRLLYERLAHRVRSLSFMVALGTHPALTDEEMNRLVGVSAGELRANYPKARLLNHRWKTPGELVTVGTLKASEVDRITDGLFKMDVTVTCNKAVIDNDLLLIVGPVFPHEVVGFSGGNKYIFPGIAGQGIIDFFHWLGAVITSPSVIGNKLTPVRAVVDHVAGMLSIERKAFCLVVKPGENSYGNGGEPGLAGLYFGTPEAAWSDAADLSAKLHTRYMGRKFHTILASAPAMYDDLWTGGKCMYKTEPIAERGGRVIIHAPHITEISRTHGDIIEKIGYHTRDFFLKQWERYKHYPWGVLAHSTHVKGLGTYENGIEKPHVEVILATGINEKVCRQVNLGYMDHRTIDIREFECRENEGVLHVKKAGEILYRV
ncbi:MAG: lactate racemase domain-containing protein [bacterium]